MIPEDRHAMEHPEFWGKSGITKGVQDGFPKALPLHFLGHYLNFSVKSIRTVLKSMKNCMEVCLEIIK